MRSARVAISASIASRRCSKFRPARRAGPPAASRVRSTRVSSVATCAAAPSRRRCQLRCLAGDLRSAEPCAYAPPSRTSPSLQPRLVGTRARLSEVRALRLRDRSPLPPHRPLRQAPLPHPLPSPSASVSEDVQPHARFFERDSAASPVRPRRAARWSSAACAFAISRCASRQRVALLRARPSALCSKASAQRRRIGPHAVARWPAPRRVPHRARPAGYAAPAAVLPRSAHPPPTRTRPSARDRPCLLTEPLARLQLRLQPCAVGLFDQPDLVEPPLQQGAARHVRRQRRHAARQRRVACARDRPGPVERRSSVRRRFEIVAERQHPAPSQTRRPPCRSSGDRRPQPLGAAS